MEQKMQQPEKNRLQDFQQLVVGNRYMTPTAKGMAGMILFKLENKIELDQQEMKFYDELQVFLKIPS